MSLRILGRFAAAMVFLCLPLASKTLAAEWLGRSEKVFEGPPAEYEPRLAEAVSGEPLRKLTVVERVGEARRGELVRTPLFFHAGECSDPHQLQLIPLEGDSRAPIPYQADDIRRAADGGIARMHIYFPIDLAPWQRKHFDIRVGKNPAAALEPLATSETADRITFAGDDLQLSFWIDAQRGGAIAGIESTGIPISLPHELLAPRLTLVRQDAELRVQRSTSISFLKREEMEIRELAYDAGPHFAKLRVQIGPRGVPDNAEYTYRIPRRGAYFRQTQRLFPSEAETSDVVGAEANHLLGGRLLLGDSQAGTETVSLPAGLRDLVRHEHGHANSALVNAESDCGIYPVPWVQRGLAGIAGGGPEGYYSVIGPEFRRTAGANSESIRSFWGEVCYLFCNTAEPEAIRRAGRAAFHPLTAVVDEPQLTGEVLHAELAALQAQFEATHARDWKQEVGRLYTMDQREEFLKRWQSGGKPGEDQSEMWVRGAVAARAKLMEGRTEPIKEYEKGQASGPLDPWHLTYGSSPAVALAALAEPSEKVDRLCAAVAEAQRAVNGRVDSRGFPYIDCFATAFNMQVGSLLMASHAGKQFENPELRQFARDALRPPPVLCVYGHGQRTYESLPGNTGDSDMLYAANSDFWLRIIELACEEDLWIHPSVYGRYFDCIDVNADLMQHSPDEPGKRPQGWHRANFFRGQSHDHRWESWATAPFMGMLENGSDAGFGVSEACYYARHERGHWINWPEITTFALADLALHKGLDVYQAPPAPALPERIEVHRAEEGNRISWKPVGRALGYRVYRAAREGGPWTLLNSPYTEPARPLVVGAEFHDPSGAEGDRYHVTAIDSALRESRWFPEEPLPAAGRRAGESSAATTRSSR